MKVIKNYSLILSFIISISSAFSQTDTGSPYSLNELGEINFLGNVSNLSMGGVDAAIDSIEFNINNPSSLAKLKTTNYLIGTFYKSTGISNNVSTDNINTANILIFIIIGNTFNLGQIYYFSLFIIGIFMTYHQFLMKKRQNDQYFKAFINNNYVGMTAFVGILLSVTI